jgi:FtsH-binding integral membrane protein
MKAVNKERSYDISGRDEALSRAFMNEVYLWMTYGLVTTGIAAYYTASSMTILSMLFGHGAWPMIALVVIEFGLVIYLSAKVGSLSPTAAKSLFFAYSAINGLTLAPIFLIYTSETVSTAFFTTAATFGAMSVYGTMTRRDLSEWGSFFKMGLFGLMIALVINMFVGSSQADLVISIMGVIIFTGLTAYNTHKLRRFAEQSSLSEETLSSFAIIGALTLYLDFINIFLFLLQIFGRRR